MGKKRSPRHKELDLDMLERASRVYRVLSHPVRLKLVELLLEEIVSVGELADHVKLAPAAVSQHLNIMRANGSVDSRRDGKRIYYRVVSPQAKYMIKCLRDNEDTL